MKVMKKFWLGFLGTMAVGVASAEVVDRPTGIKIGQRMTLKPYVSLSLGYDSNPAQSHSGKRGDALWTINPGLGLDYMAENWALKFNAYYNFRTYHRGTYVNDRNSHSYGEDLSWAWANSGQNERGWALRLSESYSQLNMADDISYGNGAGAYNGDRRQFSIQGAVQRRFTERWHSDLTAGYYMLKYDNDESLGGANYGWQRWTAGWQAGYAPSPWTDFILSLGYHGYEQDNNGGYCGRNNSQGYSAQAGIGSYATERISYRALAGWSRFEYSNGATTDDGFVYTISGNWRISETWNTSLLASSYYQPSERQVSSRSRVDSVSWGIAKSMVRNKLRATFDVSYRRETHEAARVASNIDYTLDIFSGRLGLNYILNRFLTAFAYCEYYQSVNSECERDHGRLDYDRWRVTGGLRLTY